MKIDRVLLQEGEPLQPSISSFEMVERRCSSIRVHLEASTPRREGPRCL